MILEINVLPSMLKGQMSTISFGIIYNHSMIRVSISSKYETNLLQQLNVLEDEII